MYRLEQARQLYSDRPDSALSAHYTKFSVVNKGFLEDIKNCSRKKHNLIRKYWLRRGFWGILLPVQAGLQERNAEQMASEQSEDYRVLIRGGQGEIVEKKSRFIATVRRVETEQEAAAFIEEMKKKYWDARHNCSAFVIGSRGQLTRCNDDGEPSGTAGRPMLEVLLAEEIRNVAVVVTRYFGGTLLGTGGLVRAYTQAVKAGLADSITGVMRQGLEIELQTDYNGVGKVLYILGERGLEPVDSRYGQDVRLTLQIRKDQAERLQKELVEATCGRIVWECKKEVSFIDKNGAKS